MAKCFVCGAETSLYADGKPICLKCDDARPSSPTLPKYTREASSELKKENTTNSSF